MDPGQAGLGVGGSGGRLVPTGRKLIDRPALIGAAVVGGDT